MRAHSGEYLLAHTDLLVEEIQALKRENVSVSVKIRAGIASDDRRLAKEIWRAGADIIHVDMMISVTRRSDRSGIPRPLILIANNSMNTSTG